MPPHLADEDKAPPLTDQHDDGLEEPNTWERTDQKQHRLAIYYRNQNDIVILWFGGQRDDENPMVACQN
jgi:hypothetical protein